MAIRKSRVSSQGFGPMIRNGMLLVATALTAFLVGSWALPSAAHEYWP